MNERRCSASYHCLHLLVHALDLHSLWIGRIEERIIGLSFANIGILSNTAATFQTGEISHIIFQTKEHLLMFHQS